MIEELGFALGDQGGWILALPFGLAFWGAAQQRTTGFGFGFIAGAGFLSVFEPIIAVMYTSIANILLSGVSTVQLRKDISVPAVGWLIVWMAPGIAAGAWAIGGAERWMLQGLALALTLWAVGVGTIAILAERRQGGIEALKVPLTAKTSMLPGMLAGFLGTSIGVPGPPIIGYLARLGLSPYQMRSTLLGVFAVNSVARLVLFSLFFALPGFSWAVLAVLLICTALGMWLGGYLGEVVPKGWFAYINVSTLAASGAILAFFLVEQFTG